MRSMQNWILLGYYHSSVSSLHDWMPLLPKWIYLHEMQSRILPDCHLRMRRLLFELWRLARCRKLHHLFFQVLLRQFNCNKKCTAWDSTCPTCAGAGDKNCSTCVTNATMPTWTTASQACTCNYLQFNNFSLLCWNFKLYRCLHLYFHSWYSYWPPSNLIWLTFTITQSISW
jgi:hypothetical protein